MDNVINEDDYLENVNSGESGVIVGFKMITLNNKPCYTTYWHPYLLKTNVNITDYREEQEKDLPLKTLLSGAKETHLL